jgi:hypothetical protein
MTDLDEIETWFDAAGPRGGALPRVDGLVMAAAPGRPWVPARCSATG